MRPIHIKEYYSALKGKEIPLHATTSMNLKDIMLSETSQSEKSKCCLFRFYEVKRVKIESKRGAARAPRGGAGSRGWTGRVSV